MRQGLTNAEACRQVGINIRTGRRWRYGRHVRVNGRDYTYGPIAAGPPVISSRFLSENERLHIADLHRSRRSEPSRDAPRRRSAASCAATPTPSAVPMIRMPPIGALPAGARVHAQAS